MANAKSPSSMDRYIGSRIRMRRILIGMSQEKLGARLGITFQQIQKYENGINRVGAARLHEIGDILGVPASFFFKGQEGKATSEDPQAPSDPFNLLSRKDSLQLLQAFNTVTDQKVRQAMVNLARALAGQAVDDETEIKQPSSARRKASSHSS